MITLFEAARKAGFDPSATNLDWAVVLSTLSQPGAVGGPYTNQTIICESADLQCRSTMTLGVPGGRPLRLVGDGPVDQNVTPVGQLPRGCSFYWRNPPADGGPMVRIQAPSTMLERLAFRGDGTKMGALSNGVVVEAYSILTDVWVTNLKVAEGGAAVRIAGFHNGWHLMRTHVRGLWGAGHGVYVAPGGDVNAGLSLGLDVSDVQEGAGLWDNSFLGNTHVGGMIHQGGTNKQSPAYAANHTRTVDPATGAVTWTAASGNNRSRFLGCYTEGDGTVPNRIAQPASWVTGQGAVTGGGGTLSEGKTSGYILQEPVIRATGNASGSNPARVMRLELDKDGNGSVDTFYELVADTKTGSAHLDWWRLMEKGASASEVLAWKGKTVRVSITGTLADRIKADEALIAAAQEKLDATAAALTAALARIQALEDGHG